MRVGLTIMIVPLEDGGIHVRVSPFEAEVKQPAKAKPDVLSVHLDKSPHVANDTDLRLWVNSVVRLVARTLEDDLYESWKATTLPNPPARRDS